MSEPCFPGAAEDGRRPSRSDAEPLDGLRATPDTRKAGMSHLGQSGHRRETQGPGQARGSARMTRLLSPLLSIAGSAPATVHRRMSESVVRGGVEPPTFRFSGGRTYQLSYLTKTGAPTPR